MKFYRFHLKLTYSDSTQGREEKKLIYMTVYMCIYANTLSTNFHYT